ncbi:MAG: endonuclease domain-containing protein [Mycobacteriales bacterium]
MQGLPARPLPGQLPQARGRAGQPRGRREVLPVDRLRCRDCGEVKALEEFPRNKRYRTGRHPYCKPCHNARGRESKQRLYGGSGHYHRRYRYGMEDGQWDEMMVDQGDLCAICREAPAAHVDHDHLTGEVRGILCFNCNGGLGQFRDRVDIMLRAIDYLERTRTRQWPRTLVSMGAFPPTSPPRAAAASATSSEPPPPTCSPRG